MDEAGLFINSQERDVDYLRKVAQSCKVRKDVKSLGGMIVL
jgi:hypothetical protein